MSKNKSRETFAKAITTVEGNLSEEAKQKVTDFYSAATEGAGFARHIAKRLEPVEANVYEKANEPGKQEVKLVFEIDVTEDMCNFGNSMHGGCTAYIVDVCSSVALSLLAGHTAISKIMHVSLSLHTFYHAPAPLGCRLRIENYTVVLGGRVYTARTEIYDQTHNRLVATGVHVKMPPSLPKL